MDLQAASSSPQGPFSWSSGLPAPGTCTRAAAESAAPALVPGPAALRCLCRRPHLCLSAGIYWPRFDTRACCESPTRRLPGFVSFLALLPLLAACKRRSTATETLLFSVACCVLVSRHIFCWLWPRGFFFCCRCCFFFLPCPTAADPVRTHRSVSRPPALLLASARPALLSWCLNSCLHSPHSPEANLDAAKTTVHLE